MITLVWGDGTQLTYILDLVRLGSLQGIAIYTRNKLITMYTNSKDSTLAELKGISILSKPLLRTYQAL